MNKKILLLVLLFGLGSMQLFCDSDKPFFYLSDTERELYETGELNSDKFMVTLGEHQNTAISPNVFNSLGFCQSSSQLVPVENFGTLVFEGRAVTAVLIPAAAPFSLADLFSQNYYLRGSFNLQYPISIPVGSEDFKFAVSPYIQFDTMVGIYPQIVNIAVQSFFSLNCGADLAGTYRLSDEIRIGADFSTFLIGVDTGRSGYNKDYIPDFVFSHFGYYLELNLELFCEFDISRTESLRFEYSHGMNSYYGGVYSVISGEHRFGISYIQKLVR